MCVIDLNLVTVIDKKIEDFTINHGLMVQKNSIQKMEKLSLRKARRNSSLSSLSCKSENDF